MKEGAGGWVDAESSYKFYVIHHESGFTTPKCALIPSALLLLKTLVRMEDTTNRFITINTVITQDGGEAVSHFVMFIIEV